LHLLRVNADSPRATGVDPHVKSGESARSLLALLLIHANRVVPAERILDDLWGRDAPGRQNALWVYISRLRSALEPDRIGRGSSEVLLREGGGYLLAVDPASPRFVRCVLSSWLLRSARW
jgi:DNA-binding response OmpR family regulator